MTNAELIAKIKAEIERRYKEFDGKTGDIATASRLAYLDVISFLDTLESEKPMQEGLEEEIDRFEDWMETYNQADYPTSFTTRDIARHFAKWGAEHAKKGETPVPKDLEEAAESFAFKSLDDVVLYGCTLSGRRACFIAGAKWDRIQMMKEAVPFYEILNAVPPGPERENVRIIIVKQD